MPVRNPYAEGAQEPTKPENPQEVKKERPLVQRYRDAVAEGVELRGLSEGLGGNLPGAARAPTPSEQRVEETGAKSAFSILETMVKDMAVGARESANAAKTAEREAMAVRLETLQEKIDGMAGNDPIDNFLRTKKLLDEYVGDAKGRLGVQPHANLDFTATATLEQMKIDHTERMAQWQREEAERDRRWKEERDDQRRRWEVEDRQWERNFGVEVRRLEHSEGNRGKNADIVGSLVGAFTENLQVRGERAAPVAANPGTLDIAPKSFMCRNAGCDATVQVPPGALEATCPKCAVVYDIKHQEA